MKILLSAAIFAVTLSGCAAVGTRNGTGVIYTDTRDSVTATDHSSSSRSGKSCAQNILGIVSTGDMSVNAAKKAGGLSKVASVEYSQQSYVGLYSETCTLVYGE